MLNWVSEDNVVSCGINWKGDYRYEYNGQTGKDGFTRGKKELE